MLLTFTMTPCAPRAKGVRCEGPAAMERAGEVHVQKSCRPRLVRVDQRHEREIRRVVDQDVEPAEPLDRRGDDPFAVGGLSHIRGDDEDGASVRFVDRRRRMDERLLVAPRDRHVRPRARKGAGDRKANPRPSPGDERDFARELALSRHAIP